MNLREMTDAQLQRTSNGDLQAAMTAAGIAFAEGDTKADLLGKIASFHQSNPLPTGDAGQAQAEGGAAVAEQPAPVQAEQPQTAAPAGWAQPQTASVDINMLGAVVNATLANSFVYLGTDQSAGLVQAGFVEVNEQIVDQAGGVATRATAAGIAHFQAQTVPVQNEQPAPVQPAPVQAELPPASAGAVEQPPASAGAAATVATSGGFTIASVPLPERKSSGRSGRGSSYPFDKLEVGQSFFVPATTAKPNPRKSLASTVSSATRKYATDTGQTRPMKVKGILRQVKVYSENRKFEVFDGTGDHYGQPGVKGAIIARTK